MESKTVFREENRENQAALDNILTVEGGVENSFVSLREVWDCLAPTRRLAKVEHIREVLRHFRRLYVMQLCEVLLELEYALLEGNEKRVNSLTDILRQETNRSGLSSHSIYLSHVHVLSASFSRRIRIE